MISSCRLCGSKNLETVIDLGDQALSGVFPRLGQEVARAPLHLLRCVDGCGFVQLADTADLNLMYGDGYGYRSGLNKSMVAHLHDLVHHAHSYVALAPGDLVVDIGSNDGTTLSAYEPSLDRIGVDPTGSKFRRYYPEGSTLVPSFFSAKAVREKTEKKARIVTSFAMFYDLEDPVAFAKDVASILDEDGVWMTEQSYLPAMMQANAYDTICQEHIGYYALAQIQYIAERSGLVVVDAWETPTNGGSFVVVLSKSHPNQESLRLLDLIKKERSCGLDQFEPYAMFAYRVDGSRRSTAAFLNRAFAEGKRVFGLGASTKGNVVLQSVGVTAKLMPFIGDVNPDKHGCVTPGTGIHIISEDEALALNPDYFLVLPWHFRDFFLRSTKFRGRRLVFPLPQIEMVIP